MLQRAVQRAVQRVAMPVDAAEWRSVAQDLFGSGAEGGLYPIGDLKRQGKLYTDSALATVLTDAGDPLGGANDLSGNSNPLTQATDTDRPVYGIVPFGGRRNLLTHTEDFGNAAWQTSSGADKTVSADGVVVEVLSDGGSRNFRQTGMDVTGLDRLVITISLRAVGIDRARIGLLAGSFIPYLSGVVVSGPGDIAGSGSLPAIENLSTTDATVVELVFDSSGESSVGLYLYPRTVSDQFAGDSVEIMDRPQLEEGTEATPYQRVVTQYEVTESGKPSAHVLHFNGTNQYLSSSYPAGTYTVCVAGINGSWFGEVSHAGGAFDIGPTTVTGGPADLLAATGEVVAFIPREGSISTAQKSRILDYVQQLGAGEGEVTP